MPLSSPSVLQFPQCHPESATTDSTTPTSTFSLNGQLSGLGLSLGATVNHSSGDLSTPSTSSSIYPNSSFSLPQNGNRDLLATLTKSISEASEDMLVQCGNIAFSKLYNTHEGLKREFQVLQTIYQDLLKEKERLSTERNMLDNTLAAILNKIVLRDDGILTPPGHYKFDNPISLLYSILDSAKECQELSHDSFPGLKYWSFDDWEQLKHETNGVTVISNNQDGSNRKNEVPSDLRYLEDSNGMTISFSRLSKAPAKWGEVDAETFEYFTREMRRKCIEFRLCSDNWKAQQYALGHYADWYRNHIRSKQYTGFNTKPKSVYTSRKRQRSISSANETDSYQDRIPKNPFNNTSGIPMKMDEDGLFTLPQSPKSIGLTSLVQEAAKSDDKEPQCISSNLSELQDDLDSNIEAIQLGVDSMPTGTSAVTSAPSKPAGVDSKSCTVVVQNPFAIIKFPPHPTPPNDGTITLPTQSPKQSPVNQQQPQSESIQPASNSGVMNVGHDDRLGRTSDGGNSSAIDNLDNVHNHPRQTKKSKKRMDVSNSEPLQLPTDNPNTAKNLAITEWLRGHPEGLKSDFEGYWRGLSADEKKPFQQRSAILKRAEKKAN
ncbi:hypothetical protein ABKN59_008564 [Abortiporus biennis]